MGRVGKPVVQSQRAIRQLQAIASQWLNQVRLVLPDEIILLCSEGMPVNQIAEKLDIRPNCATDWRKRFEQKRGCGFL